MSGLKNPLRMLKIWLRELLYPMSGLKNLVTIFKIWLWELLYTPNVKIEKFNENVKNMIKRVAITNVMVEKYSDNIWNLNTRIALHTQCQGWKIQWECWKYD